MRTKKVVWIVLLSNLVWLSVAIGLLLFSRAVQAAGSAAPASAASIGPFYQSFSGSDFHSFRDDFAITRDNSWGLVHQTSQGIGVTGVHLPQGATITQIMLDGTYAGGNGETLLFYSCAIGGSGVGQCAELARATINSGGRQQITTNLNWATNPYTEALHLQIFIDNSDSIFYYARIAYTLPAPTFLPVIQR